MVYAVSDYRVLGFATTNFGLVLPQCGYTASGVSHPPRFTEKSLQSPKSLAPSQGQQKKKK
jgi:hypothetical protein